MLGAALQTGIIGYAALLGAMYVGQRRLLYVPDRHRPQLGALAALGVGEVALHTGDGLALLAWYLPPPADAPVVLYLHGNGGHIGYRGERLRQLAAAGLGVLLVEYRGYGGNPGRPTAAGLARDADAALAFLAAGGIATGRVVVYGESLGSAVAVRLAAENPVAALVLEAPFTSVAAVAQRRFPFVPALWLVRDRFDSAALIGQIGAPILFLHAEDDRVVPIRFGRALYAAAPEPKEAWYAPRGGHDATRYGGFDAAIAFIRRRLAAAPLVDAAQ